MAADADGARGRSKPAPDLRGVELLPKGQLEDCPVVRLQLRERLENARTLLRGDQLRERAISDGGLRGRGSEPFQRPPFSSRRPHPVQTDSHRRLKDVSRQSIEVLDAALPKSLVHPAERLLGDVLGGIPVVQSPGGEQAQPSSKVFELRTHLVGMF